MRFDLAVILFNPKSTGDSERNAKRFARRLERASLAEAIQVIPTSHKRHAEEIIDNLSKKKPPLLVVSSSGDGGYNEVVNGAMRARSRNLLVVTGLLPSGNANDHYKAMHRPYVIRRLKAGQLQTIDVLQIQATVKGKTWQRFAHSYIGFGITSEVGKALNETDLTPTKELIISAKTILGFEPFEALVRGRQQAFQSIIISNVGKMSKYLKMSKHARLNDGLFEIITVEAERSKLISSLVKSATVGLPHEKQAKSFSFKTIKPLRVQLDGEVFTIDANSPVKVTIVAKGLECII